MPKLFLCTAKTIKVFVVNVKTILNNKSMLLSYLTMVFMGHPGPLFHLFSFVTHNFTKKLSTLAGLEIVSKNFTATTG